MTKEELEKEAEEFTDSKKSFWRQGRTCIDSVKQAYIASAEPRENQIEIDAIHIRALQKQNGELTDRLTEAKEIIKELLSSCFGYNSKTVNYEVKAKAEQFLKNNA